MGPRHWGETARVGGLAADNYELEKRRRNHTEARCSEVGLQYRPVIHEMQGGMSKGADLALRAIAEAVAAQEGRVPGAVRAEIASRIAVLLARSGAQAVRQRGQRVRPQRRHWAVTSQLRLGPLGGE